MAIVIESATTGGFNTASSLTLTKPTGLAVGDLMIACTATDTSTPPTLLAGWTSIGVVEDFDDFVYMRAMAKIADAGDVAASNFTFSHSGAQIAGVLYRITGHAGIANIFSKPTEDASSPVSTGTIAYDAPGTESALIIFALAGDNDGDNATFSGYNITGGTNPTWTERLDVSDTSGIRASFAAADAIYTDVGNTITAAGFTGSGAVDAYAIFFLAISDLVDAAGTVALYEPTITKYDPNGTSDTNATLGLYSATSYKTNPNSSVSGDIWTPQTKNTTTWTNQDKS